MIIPIIIILREKKGVDMLYYPLTAFDKFPFLFNNPPPPPPKLPSTYIHLSQGLV